MDEYGFGDREPDYESYDERGDLRLELYVDETSGTACGFAHDYRYTYDLEKREYLYGFTIDAIYEQEWEEPDPFDMKSVDGTDGADQVEEYEETLDYREDGQPNFFYQKDILTGCGMTKRKRNTKIRFCRLLISTGMTALYFIVDTGITAMCSVRLSSI